MRASRWLLMVIGTALLVEGTRTHAADERVTRSPGQEALDRLVHKALYKALCDGVDLFNDGKHAASAYFFQATATTVEPLLEHRPELRKTLREGLEDARALTNSVDRARVLYDVLMDAYERTRVHPRIAKPRLGDTLWERMGGEEGVTKFIDEFVEAALKNPKINFTRDGAYLKTPEQIARMKRRFVRLASALGKGPYK